MSSVLARLQAANLSNDELLRMNAELYAMAPPPHRCAVDELLNARNAGVPGWAVSSVLLSPDLIPRLFASLDIVDCAAARVCKAWRQGWTDTDALRRGLRPGRQIKLVDNPNINWYDLAASPCSDLVAVRTSMNSVEVIEYQTMSSLGTCHHYEGEPLMSEDYLYVVEEHGISRHHNRPPFDMVNRTEYDELPDEVQSGVSFFCGSCLGGSATACDDHPGGLLFAVSTPSDASEYEDEDGLRDEVFAFDALTLHQCFRFGRGIFQSEAYCMAVVGDELYVGDCRGCALQVFSLTGQYLRQICGDWRQPRALSHFNGRLYLVEMDGTAEDGQDEETWCPARHEAGKRILVLTPEGQRLQVWKPPELPNGPGRVERMAICRNEMLVHTDLRRGLHIHSGRLWSVAGI